MIKKNNQLTELINRKYGRKTGRTIRAAALMLIMALLLLGVIDILPYVKADAAPGTETEDETQQVETPVQGIEGGAFEITDFTCSAVINKDHSYDVEEQITVNIPDTLRSIDFAIPSGNFRIGSIDVPGVAFNATTGTDSSYVTITDPDSLITGIHQYTIRYRIMEFADRNDDVDILYFNLLQPDWKQPIQNIDIRVSFPEDFPMDELKCYSGQFGVRDNENRINFEPDEDAHTAEITGKMIPENYGITLKAEIPGNYWEGALDGIWAIFAMLLVMIALVMLLFVLWTIGGRDPRIRKLPETKPIEGVQPQELGFIFNSRIDAADMVRFVIYLAKKGYLRITEYEPKRYRLYRLRDPDSEEKLIRNAYNILFEDVYKGRAVEMDQIAERLVRIESTLKDDIAAGFSSREMQAYTPMSRAFRMVGIVLTGAGLAIACALKYSYQYLPVNYLETTFTGVAAIVLIYLLCSADDRKYSTSGESGKVEEFILGILTAVITLYTAGGIARQTGYYGPAIMVAVLTGTAVFLSVVMRARGKGNAILVSRLRQLRKFIYHPTPKEILENYLADTEYYYDMMMFALAFGAEETWAISFLTLDVPEPGWYRDEIEGHAFSNLRESPVTIDLARDLRSFTRTIEAAYQEIQRRRR